MNNTATSQLPSSSRRRRRRLLWLFWLMLPRIASKPLDLLVPDAYQLPSYHLLQRWRRRRREMSRQTPPPQQAVAGAEVLSGSATLVTRDAHTGSSFKLQSFTTDRLRQAVCPSGRLTRHQRARALTSTSPTMSKTMCKTRSRSRRHLTSQPTQLHCSRGVPVSSALACPLGTGSRQCCMRRRRPTDLIFTSQFAAQNLADSSTYKSRSSCLCLRWPADSDCH